MRLSKDARFSVRLLIITVVSTKHSTNFSNILPLTPEKQNTEGHRNGKFSLLLSQN